MVLERFAIIQLRHTLSLPIAERLANEELSLPIGPAISIKDVATVVYHINNFK